MKLYFTFLLLLSFGALSAQKKRIAVDFDTCLNFIEAKVQAENKLSNYIIKGRAEIKLHRMYVGEESNYTLLAGNAETDSLLLEILDDWKYECSSDAVISCQTSIDSSLFQDSIDMNYYRFTSEKDTVGKLIVLQIQWEHWYAFSDYHEHLYQNYVYYPKEKRYLTYADLVDTLHEKELANFVCNAYADRLIDMEYSEEDKKLVAWDYANDSYNLLNNFRVTDSSVIFYLTSETEYFSLDYEIEVKIADFPNSFNKKFKKMMGL